MNETLGGSSQPRAVGRRARLIGAICACFMAGAVRAEERLVTIFEGRQISVSVPAGWRFVELRDSRTGVQTVQIVDPKREIQLDASFLPDPEGRLTARGGLEAEMRKVFAFYLTGSVEREMKFTALDVSDGVGAYTSFTDRSLVDRKVPNGEHLMSTIGIRSWKGAYLMFTLLSNSRETEAYRQALEIIRASLKEVHGPKGAAGHH